MIPLLAKLKGLPVFRPAVTRAGAVCLTCGAVCGFCALFAGLDVCWAFVLGSLLPFWPLVWYFNSPRRVKQELELFERWHKDKLITQQHRRKLQQAAIDALAAKWYGRTTDKEGHSNPVE